MDRRAFTLSLAAAAPWAGVRAQSFPSRPITLIAPSVPGGSTDAVCRALAESVARRLGVPVTVENKAGAGGALGGVALAGAKPDGHTVALLPLAVFRIALMQKMAFDPLRDITYVAGLGGFVFGLAVPAAAPYRTLGDLLDVARKHPGEITYGHAGVGTTPHLAVEELALKTGVQFTAVPWLREHLIGEARRLVVDLAPDPDDLQALARDVAQRLPEVFREGGTGIADLFTTAEQRHQLAQLTAVMSLLEGHADVVMDDVGPAHIRSVAEIRAKFTQRRKGAGALDVMLRRLLGLEAKMRQYRDGAAFVRGVQEAVGVEGFNAVWTSPQTLPLPEEIADPQAWVHRVHG